MFFSNNLDLHSIPFWHVDNINKHLFHIPLIKCFLLYLSPTPVSLSLFMSLPLFLPRLFGLKDIIIPGNCSSPYDLNLNDNHDWPVYVNPGILFLLYITIATVLKTGCHGAPNQVSVTCSLLGLT